MLVEFYVQVQRVLDQRNKPVRLRVAKYTMDPPDTVAPGCLVIKVPLEIPLEAFEPLTAEKMVIKPRAETVSAPADPQDSTIALARELAAKPAPPGKKSA